MKLGRCRLGRFRPELPSQSGGVPLTPRTPEPVRAGSARRRLFSPPAFRPPASPTSPCTAQSRCPTRPPEQRETRGWAARIPPPPPVSTSSARSCSPAPHRLVRGRRLPPPLSTGTLSAAPLLRPQPADRSGASTNSFPTASRARPRPSHSPTAARRLVPDLPRQPSARPVRQLIFGRHSSCFPVV